MPQCTRRRNTGWESNTKMMPLDRAHHKAKGTGTSAKPRRTVKSLREELRRVKEKLGNAEGIINMLRG
jgi:hypothetical protein